MITISTKADTLKSIEGLLQNAIVLPQVSFCVNEWENNAPDIIDNVVGTFGHSKVIVRSSAVDEDTASSSSAGKNLSLQNISTDADSLENAVNQVIASYEADNPDNQVLIQPMIENVVMYGVAFTMDPNTLGEYYVISYDTSGASDAITSGESRSADEVKSFISMIEAGKDYEKEQLQPYRDYMTSLFDGQVCERIYDFVENRL